MECKYTCFDRVLHQVKSLPNNMINDACDIITNDSLIDLLDFGINNNCFTKPQSMTLYEGIIMWEDLESNYYEEDPDKLDLLYEKMGISKEILLRYQENLDS